MLGSFLVSCSELGSERQIESTRVATLPSKRAVPGAGSADRFGGGMGPATNRPAGSQPAGSGAASGTPELKWDTPPGWIAKAPTDMRIANFQVGADPEAECYLTVLQGSGGGLLSNVNRWRGQMGLPPVSETDVANMPRRKLLGAPAAYIDIQGQFTGMGAAAQADYRMVGAILSLPQGAVFVKMVGSVASLEGQEEGFAYFCDSMRLEDPSGGEVHGPGDGHNHGGEDLQAGMGSAEPDLSQTDFGGMPATSGSLRFEAPEGWVREDPKPMREVSYRMGTDSECYVAILGGNGGGVEANFNRWRGQLGLPAFSASELAALPRILVLGQKASMMEAHGDFTGMGGDTQSGSGLLGLVCPQGSQTIFIKMIGPSDELRAERERFVEFCQSMRRGH